LSNFIKLVQILLFYLNKFQFFVNLIQLNSNWITPLKFFMSYRTINIFVLRGIFVILCGPF